MDLQAFNCRKSVNQLDLTYVFVETRPHIVFVDDNSDDVEIACWHLAKLGLQTSHAVTSSEQQLSTELSLRRPSVIVSDLIMPLFDGWGALRVSRALAPAVPFTFHSGSIGEDVQRTAARLGVFGCVEKHCGEHFALLMKKALDQPQTEQSAPSNFLQSRISAKSR